MYKNQATKLFLSKYDELSPMKNLKEALNSEYVPWNGLYHHTYLRNYASFSLQVSSNLSILSVR
jgi:hypothetical protein